MTTGKGQNRVQILNEEGPKFNHQQLKLIESQVVGLEKITTIRSRLQKSERPLHDSTRLHIFLNHYATD